MQQPMFSKPHTDFQEEMLLTIQTDHERGAPGCKLMSSFPIQYDDYMRNHYFFQFRIEENYDEQVQAQTNNLYQSAGNKLGSMGQGGVKMSIGFCKDNFDLNKNSIIENKKKEYYVLDLFDGEAYSGKIVQNRQDYIKYMNPN